MLYNYKMPPTGRHIVTSEKAKKKKKKCNLGSMKSGRFLCIKSSLSSWDCGAPVFSDTELYFLIFSVGFLPLSSYVTLVLSLPSLGIMVKLASLEGPE